MSTLRRHRFNQLYLPAHWLCFRQFWLYRTLQHIDQHIIVKAAERNLPAAPLRLGLVQCSCQTPHFVPPQPPALSPVPLPRAPSGTCQSRADKPAASEGNYLRCLLPGGRSYSKYPAELLLASISSTKRRSGGRYLLVVMRAGGIGVREVDFCGACDQEQAKVRNLPFGRFRGPLCPVAISVSHFPHCTIWQPRCRGASAVLL